VVKSLEHFGIRDAFCVTGGAIAQFTFELSKSRLIRTHFMLTEQSAGIAAEAYGHYDNRPAVLVVTSGPGVTNAMTPVAAAWTNSTPMIVISGQARSQDVVASKALDCRQVGNQHLNTAGMVGTIVKDFLEVTSLNKFHYDLMNFFEKSTEGRNGPVWISLPSDIQRIKLDYAEVLERIEPYVAVPSSEGLQVRTEVLIDRIIAEFMAAKRPAILIGNGARSDLIQDAISRISERFDAAILTTWPALDLVSKDNPRLCGRPGTIPSSWMANFVQQSCDFLLILGVRLDLAQVGYQPENFAQNANKIRIEIDDSEHFRIPKLSHIETFTLDSKLVVSALLSKSEGISVSRDDWWKEICTFKKWPKAGENQPHFLGLDIYEVITQLAEREPKNIVLGSSGTCIEMALQSWESCQGQRFLNSGGLGSMGFALAAAYGVSKKTKGELLVIESDGSLAMNLQDFFSILQSPNVFRIVLLNSRGYKSIDLSQKRQRHDLHGTSVKFGVPLPEYSKFLPAIGIRYRSISHSEELKESLTWLFSGEETSLLDVMVSSDQEATPRLISKLDSNGQMKTADFLDLWPPR
jgi:acetolactate synthase-1/2/3 large subunit